VRWTTGIPSRPLQKKNDGLGINQSGWVMLAIRGKVGMARPSKILCTSVQSKAVGDLLVTDRLAAGDRQGGRLNPAIGWGLFPEMVASPGRPDWCTDWAMVSASCGNRHDTEKGYQS
jgi:hypothetical protein